MKHLVLAGILAAAPGFAIGQDDFTRIDPISNGRVFPIGDINSLNRIAQPLDAEAPHPCGESAENEPPLLVIEHEGIRLPEQTLETVSP